MHDCRLVKVDEEGRIILYEVFFTTLLCCLGLIIVQAVSSTTIGLSIDTVSQTVTIK